MPDLTFKIDADTGGFIGAIKKATTTMKDFGIVGGPPILAMKAAVAGVEGALKGVTTAAKGASRAWGSFVEGGKGAVAILNQINGAVELANKVIPALTFPLAMAENADRAKGSFEALKKSWGELAGALGTGINDALIPMIKGAGKEMEGLKVQAREVGEGIGYAINFSRASMQLGSFGEILGLGMQKALIQFGMGLLSYALDFGAKIGNLMEQAIVKVQIEFKKLVGMDGVGQSQSELRRLQKEASGDRPVLPSEMAAVSKVDELTAQIQALSQPVDERIKQEKVASEAAQKTATIYQQINAGLRSMFKGTEGSGGSGGGNGSGGGGASWKPGGAIYERLDAMQDKMMRESLGMRAPRLSGGDPMAWQGPPLPTGMAGNKPLKAARAPGAPNRQMISLARQFGRQAGTGSGAQGWQEFLSSGVRTSGLNAGQIGGLRRMDPSQLAQTVTNKGGRTAADKQEREAAQRDAKTGTAIDTVVRTLPTLASDMTAVKNHLSKIQSR